MLGFRVYSSRFGVWGLGFMFLCLGFRVLCLWFMVYGLVNYFNKHLNKNYKILLKLLSNSWDLRFRV